MVGITLSPEQIREAPPDVRRWLEQQIAGALGTFHREPAIEAPERHLIACSVEGAQGILNLIKNLLPAVGVFFELGREPAIASTQGLRALRVDDMLRHSRLQGPEQVIACLQTLDQALQHVRREPDAALTALDGAGHCIVADATAQSIHALWQQIVAAHDLQRPDVMTAAAATPITAPPPFQAPYAISVPAFTTPQAVGDGGG